MEYPNLLVKWVIPAKDLNVVLKCFSHLAAHPKEVENWVPLNLEQLGDTIMFDKRTIEEMNGKNIDFLMEKKGAKRIRGIIVT